MLRDSIALSFRIQLKTRVLNYTPNRELGVLRSALLRLGGCDVTLALSQEVALSEIRTGRHLTLILCHETKADVYRALLAEFRLHSPSGKVVYIRGPGRLEIPEADIVVDSREPQALVDIAVNGCVEEQAA